MGSPARMKKHYDTPRRPWDKEKLEEDKKILKQYGLRRKQEIHRAETMVRQIRRRARKLFAERSPEKESVLLKKIHDMGIAEKDASLDKILALNLDKLLERRLQTVVWKKKLANSLSQSRQFITHGHIMVAGRKVTSPSHIVSREDEDSIAFLTDSSLNSKFRYAEKKTGAPPASPAENAEEKKAPAKAPETDSSDKEVPQSGAGTTQ